MTRTLSLLIPCYNESKNISALLEEVSAYFSNFVLNNREVSLKEILIVNDGSVDSTAKILAECAQKIPQIKIITHSHNLGYGAALRSGIAATTSEYLLIMDGDGQYPIENFEQLWRTMLTSKADTVGGIRSSRADTLMRHINGQLWTTLMRLTLGFQLKDLGAGFKLYNMNKLKQIPTLISDGAFIWAEISHKLQKIDAKFAETPISHRERTFGVSTGNNFKVILKAIKEWIIYTTRIMCRAIKK